MPSSRRRTTLGLNASAALPKLWDVLDEKGWSDSDFARAVSRKLEKLGKPRMTTGGAAKLLYGDVEAHRTIAVWCWLELGLDPDLWEEVCPVKRRPHARSRETAPRRFAATG